MSLDTVGRQYADKLFQESLEEILKSQGAEFVEVSRDFGVRNMTRSGGYFTAQAEVYIRNAERLTQARVDSLLRAHEKSGIPLDNAAIQEISAEATQFSEQQGRNIVQALETRIGQTFGDQVPGGFREAISGHVLRSVSGISARVARKLSIMRDEALLAARTPPSSQNAAKKTASATPTGLNVGEGLPHVPAGRLTRTAHPKPHLYYWSFCQAFGQECYRTWRWELLASFGISVVTYLITKGDDPLAWRNFKIAFLATTLTLAGFALWHLVRTPWLVHRALNSATESNNHWAFGVFGVAVLVALVVGASLSIAYLRAVPPPPIVRIVAPPPPIPAAQVQEKAQKQSKMTISPSSVQTDRVLNSQQSEHLYQKLREFAADPNHADLISVTIAPYAYQDIESSRLTSQLTRVLEDAHWKVLRQTQLPIKLEGRVQHQIPIGIWILTSHDQNYGYFLWTGLKEVNLDSEVRPKSDLPADFNGTIIWVGYKEAPIY
jgi:hypothetical protein